jgi:hypothetical protein
MLTARFYIKTLVATFLACTLISCSWRVDKNKYFEKIKSYESGLHRKEVIQDYYFDVLYTPPEYMVLVREDQPMTRDQILERSKENTELQYYQLELGMMNERSDFVESFGKNKEMKERLLHYLSYGLQNDIFLQEGGDQYPCVLFHFERSFDLRNSRKFLLAFENGIKSDHIELIINSKLFSDKAIKIPIDKSNIPEL